MNTIKLYDADSHMFDFSATVVSCTKDNDNFRIILDRTAFFPEGGGQACDTGKIGSANVTDVQIIDDEIVHFADMKPESDYVQCSISREKRFRRMQNHSGEHIVSGIVHNLYGYDNVGFHMGEFVTVDFNGVLNEKQLEDIEFRANEAVCENVRITAEYPDENTLASLDYRSKLELTHNVRIVTIEGYDKCACCAPHVSRTGEIGIIKIIDSMKHRGGTRINMLCGLDALEDIRIKCKNNAEIAVKLCAKQNETSDVFKKYVNDTNELKSKISRLSSSIVELKSDCYSPVDGNIIIFEPDLDMQNLRKLVLKALINTSKICAGFSGNDDIGYGYAIASNNVDLKSLSKRLNETLGGKGGGSQELIQGNINATEKEIREFFNE